jgi:hypothetical protein
VAARPRVRRVASLGGEGSMEGEHVSHVAGEWSVRVTEACAALNRQAGTMGRVSNLAPGKAGAGTRAPRRPRRPRVHIGCEDRRSRALDRGLASKPRARNRARRVAGNEASGRGMRRVAGSRASGRDKGREGRGIGRKMGEELIARESRGRGVPQADRAVCGSHDGPFTVKATVYC